MARDPVTSPFVKIGVSVFSKGTEVGGAFCWATAGIANNTKQRESPAIEVMECFIGLFARAPEDYPQVPLVQEERRVQRGRDAAAGDGRGALGFREGWEVAEASS